MEIVHTRADCAASLDRARAADRTVGLVPTMGALHAGHTSLIARARAECDVVAVTIFVNPLQFGDPGDIAAYPRTLDHDFAACAEAGADLVFVPSVREMYPSWPDSPSTTVSVRGVSDAWEGASRPGHFEGVATVVAKLFSVAGRCRAYFGLKDFQQLAVVRQLTDIVVAAAGDPTLTGRTWVLLTEAPEGGWGLSSHANTNAELVSAARAQIAELAKNSPDR